MHDKVATAPDTQLAAVVRWREKLASLPPPVAPKGERLAKIAQAFVDSPWAERAASAGWTDAQLFGVDEHLPTRLDRLGLVPYVALARNTGKVVDIDGARAVILTRLGARQSFKRATVAAGSVPFWQCPALIGEPIAHEVAA